MEKMVIYKDLTGYKMTNYDNYNDGIINVNRVADFSEFESVEEIVAYSKRFFSMFKNAAEIVIKNRDDKKITVIYLYEN